MAPRNRPEDDPDAEISENLDDGDEQVAPEDEGQDEGDERDETSADDERAEEDDQETRSGDEVRERRERREAPRETAVVRAQRLAREARAEADKNARELAEMRAEMQRMRQPPQETVEQEAARLSLMEPEQRAEYRLNKALENQNRQMQAVQFRMQDQADKSTFVTLCSDNPLYRSVREDVEAKLTELRRQGQNVDREALAKYLLGERILKRAPKAVQQQRDAGNKNIRRQQVRPGAGRSDQVSDDRDRRSNDARRRRLENVTF